MYMYNAQLETTLKNAISVKPNRIQNGMKP